MALHCQGSRLKMLGGFVSRVSGNFATGAVAANGVGQLTNDRARKFSVGDASVFERSDQGGIPYGVRPPYAWALPRVAGAIKVYRLGNLTADGSADMQLGVPFASSGDMALEGSSVLDVVLSVNSVGSMAIDGSISLSSVVAITANGSIALDGACSLDLLASLISTGDMSVSGLMDIMTLQSFTASDAVVSGSTQEIIDGVVAGISGQLGLNPEQAAQLRELWRKEGLDSTRKVTHTPNSIKIGDPLAPEIEITLTGNRKTLTTMERQ